MSLIPSLTKGSEQMLFKIIASTILIGVIFCGNASAYDLPKIKVEKTVKKAPMGILKSDWEATNLFEEKLKALAEQNKKLSPASPERVSYDKNRIFIAFYKGNAYFLDKYSIEVKRDNVNGKSWTQRIFPIGQNISPKNSRATEQRFYYDGKNFYNASGKSNPLDKIADVDDKNFMRECFIVGYYFAFGEELDE